MDDQRSVTERQPSVGDRRKFLTAKQETVLVNVMIASNAIREIQSRIVEEQVVF